MPRLLFNPFTGTLDYVTRPGEKQIVGEHPVGPIDGFNKTFTTAHKFLAPSMRAHLNGQRLTAGDDYVVLESGVPGSGFDTLTLAIAPRPGTRPDVVVVDYTER